MAIVLWPRRTPAVLVPTSYPRWQRLRRGNGLARLRTRGEFARPAVLLVACTVPLAVLWQEGGAQLGSLFAGTVPRATYAVTTLVAEWMPVQVDVRQAPASRRSPTDRSPATLLAQDYSARSASPGGDQATDTSAAAVPAGGVPLGEPAAPPSADPIATPDAYVAVLASVEVAGTAPGSPPAASAMATASAPVLQTTTTLPAAAPAVPMPASSGPAAPPIALVPSAPAGAAFAAGATLPRPRTHVIAAGESLSSIASRYGVSVADLAGLNGLSDPDKIVAGVTLALPR